MIFSLGFQIALQHFGISYCYFEMKIRNWTLTFLVKKCNELRFWVFKKLPESVELSDNVGLRLILTALRGDGILTYVNFSLEVIASPIFLVAMESLACFRLF